VTRGGPTAHFGRGEDGAGRAFQGVGVAPDGGSRSRPPPHSGFGDWGRSARDRLQGASSPLRRPRTNTLRGGKREVQPQGDSLEAKEQTLDVAGRLEALLETDDHSSCMTRCRRSPPQERPPHLLQHHRSGDPRLRPRERLLGPEHRFHDYPLREVAQRQGNDLLGVRRALGPADCKRYRNHHRQIPYCVNLRTLYEIGREQWAKNQLASGEESNTS
jgi:hypothetical protein